MVWRSLVAFIFALLLVGSDFRFQGTHLASSCKIQTQPGKELHQEVFDWNLGQEKETETSSCFEHLACSSHLERPRVYTSHTITSNDVVLHSMQTAEWRQVAGMPVLWPSLESSLGRSEDQKGKEQEPEKPGQAQEERSTCSHISEANISVGSVRSVPRQSSLGCDHSSISECYKSSCIPRCSSSTGGHGTSTATGVATSTKFETRDHHRRGSQGVSQFARVGTCKFRLDHRNERPDGNVGSEGADGGVFQNIVTQSHTQVESSQGQSFGHGQSHTFPGSDMARLCWSSNEEDPRTCCSIPKLQIQFDGNLQCQSNRGVRYQRGSWSRFTESVGEEHGRFASRVRESGDRRYHQTAGESGTRWWDGLQHLGRGTGNRRSRDGWRTWDRRRDSRGQGQGERWSCQAESFAALSGAPVSDQGGKHPSQEQESRGQRSQGSQGEMSDFDGVDDEWMNAQIEEFVRSSNDLVAKLSGSLSWWPESEAVNMNPLCDFMQASHGVVERAKVRKKVRFRSICSVHLWKDGDEIQHADESMVLTCRCCSLHSGWRSFWHLNGQITAWSEMKKFAAQHHRCPWIVSCSENDDRELLERFALDHEGHGDRNSFASERSYEDAPQSDLSHARVASSTTAETKGQIANTWFLANGRFHVCVEPRRIRVSDLGDLLAIRQKCKQTWMEMIEGDDFEIQFVHLPEPGITDTALNVIVIQDRDPLQACMLFRIDSSTTVRKVRAILYRESSSALDLFIVAQVHRVCWRQTMYCCVTGIFGRREVSYCDNEEVAFDEASVVKAVMRIVDESSDEEHSEGSADLAGGMTDASTDTGGESSDEVGLLSNMPVSSLQLNHPNPYPWIDNEADLLETQAIEEPDDDVFLTAPHQNSIQSHVSQNTAPASLGPEGWLLISYGLGLTDLGRRDTMIDVTDFQGIKRKVRDLWADHLRHGFLEIQCVAPQPRLTERATLVVLVVVQYSDSEGDDLTPVLVIQDSEPDYQCRQQPYAAHVRTPACARSVSLMLGLYECIPNGMRQCEVDMRGQEMEQLQYQDVVPGSLCEVFIGAYPECAARLRHLMRGHERFLTSARYQLERHGTDHVVTLRFHGISSSNRPLGHHDIFIPCGDIRSLDWINQAFELWHFFDYDNPRLAFCEVEDVVSMEGRPRSIFHVIINYARWHGGLPVLIQQTMISSQERARVQERWAVMVNPAQQEHDFFAQVWRYPFWFHNLAHTQIRRNGDEWEDSALMVQPGERIDFLLEVRTREDMIIVMHDVQLQYEEEPPHDVVNLLQIRAGQLCNYHSFVEECWKIMKADEQTEGTLSLDYDQLCRAKPEDNLSLRSAHVPEVSEQPPSCIDQCASQDKEIAEIGVLVDQLLHGTWTGLNGDFAVLHDLHPAARFAIEATQSHKGNPSCFHVFTGGSCKGQAATWAFIALAEVHLGDCVKYCRVGFARIGLTCHMVRALRQWTQRRRLW